MKKNVYGILVYGKYLASIMGDSAIECDKSIQETASTFFSEKKATKRKQNSYICYVFIN